MVVPPHKMMEMPDDPRGLVKCLPWGPLTMHCWELGFVGIFSSLSGAFTGRRKARLFEEMPTRGHCEPYQRPRLWRKCFCRKWQPTPVFLPGKFREQRCLVGCSPCGNKESHTTKCTRMNARTHTQKELRAKLRK